MSSYWAGKRALVTGATGFIGGNLALQLLSHGAQVVTIERDLRPRNALRLLGILDRIAVVRGDVGEPNTVRRALNEYSATHCFHLAAQTLVTVASCDPLSTFESNIRGTYLLLEACRGTPSIEAVVVASSDKAYGTQAALPYTEESPLLPTYPYEVSKACADLLARSYFSSYGLPVAVVRNANIYGPGDMNFANIVPEATVCALCNRPFEIRSDGTLERDYMFVRDGVQGLLMVAEALQRGDVAGQAFNLGTQQPVSVLELHARINELAGCQVRPRILNVARHEIPRQYLDASKARRLLGWRPQHTLEEGLGETLAWYRDLMTRDPMIVHIHASRAW